MTRSGTDPHTPLVIDGGPKVRTDPWPNRGLLGAEEKAAVDALFGEAIASGDAFGYNGAEEEAYCVEFAEHLGGGHADAVNSGTNAVYVALKALELEPFTEVIVSAITDPGGIMPIPLLNCIPIVADTMPDSYNTGPDQIEPLITPLTSAIVVAHIAGEPADIAGIMELARHHHLPVVEDCAQALGAQINGHPLGTFSDIATFSTMFGKHFCTGGQGGMVFTKNETLYWKVRGAADRGKPFGQPGGGTNQTASLNLNMDELSAAIGRVQLRKLPQIVQRRRELARTLTDGIKELACVSIPQQLPSAEPSYWFWRLNVNADNLTCDKTTFCQALAAEGILLNPVYHAMPHTYDWFMQRRVFGSSGLPWTSPQYQGDPDREFPCPNATATLETHFNLTVCESWGEPEVRDILAAFRKVDHAYFQSP